VAGPGATAPVGLLQRRMSLTADARSHAVMPGTALGFLAAGYSVLALSLGGFVAGPHGWIAFQVGIGDGGERAEAIVLFAPERQ